MKKNHGPDGASYLNPLNPARQGLETGISSETMEPPVDVAELRKEYTLFGLHRRELSLDPFEQFSLWFQESVRTAGDREPNAMTLATDFRSFALER